VSILDRATDLQVERAQHERLKEQVRDQYAFSNIVGKSKKMRELFELIDAVAESDANILVVGENGVGKELIANAAHVRSGRASGPFIKINCASLPKELIESELFGYKKGAFTGATSDKVGLLELAAGGSLMLDEIGEMPLVLQTRVNQDGVTVTGSLNVTVRSALIGKSVAPLTGKVATTSGARSPTRGVIEKVSIARPSSELAMLKSVQRIQKEAPFGMLRPVRGVLTEVWLPDELPFRAPAVTLVLGLLKSRPL